VLALRPPRRRAAPPRRHRRAQAHCNRCDRGGVEVDDDEEEESDKPANACVVVWEGTVGKRAFTTFEMIMCRTEEYARDTLQKYGVPHYWDSALAQLVTEQS
jgi:hypothetical protein